MKWNCLESKKLISNRWLCVNKDKVSLPNGEIIDDFYRIHVSNASAVIAITEDNDIVLKNEYRYCYDKELIELPSGVFEPNENDPLQVAKRELMEETGYSSNNWIYLGPTIENSAKLTNYIHLFLATQCKKMGEQQLDKTEEIDIVVIPLIDAINMVMDNRISCNCTAHAILKAGRYFNI